MFSVTIKLYFYNGVIDVVRGPTCVVAVRPGRA